MNIEFDRWGVDPALSRLKIALAVGAGVCTALLVGLGVWMAFLSGNSPTGVDSEDTSTTAAAAPQLQDEPTRNRGTEPQTTTTASEALVVVRDGEGEPGEDNTTGQLVLNAEEFLTATGDVQPEGNHLGYITHGDTAVYSLVDFSRYSSVQISYASQGHGGQLELRAGSSTGPLLATIDLEWTGTWDEFTPTAPTPIDHDSTQSLVLVFTNDTHQADNDYLYNIDTITLLESTPPNDR